MNYIGKWVFHSVGMMNENDELVYLNGEEFLKAPMVYIDENDEEAVADELKERKMMIDGKVEVCEDGNLYLLMPLPEGVTQEQVDAAVAAGEIKLRDGMLFDVPYKWEIRNDELWAELGMSEDGYVCLSSQDGFLNVMTTRYIKAK